MGSRSKKDSSTVDLFKSVNEKVNKLKVQVQKIANFAQLMAFNYEALVVHLEDMQSMSLNALEVTKRRMMLEPDFVLPRLTLQDMLMHPYDFTVEEQKILATKMKHSEWHDLIDDFQRKRETASVGNDTEITADNAS